MISTSIKSLEKAILGDLLVEKLHRNHSSIHIIGTIELEGIEAKELKLNCLKCDKIVFQDCYNLERIPDIIEAGGLIKIINCPKLKSIDTLMFNSSRNNLLIENCPSLEYIKDLYDSTHLTIQECHSLISINKFNTIYTCGKVEFIDCRNLKTINIECRHHNNPVTVKDLTIRNCPLTLDKLNLEFDRCRDWFEKTFFRIQHDYDATI